jgi:predicted nucleotidyltransferase
MSSATDVPWAVTPEKVEAVVRRLIAAARPRKIILFGSYVRGHTHRDSDLDVLVVTEDEASDAYHASVRLYQSIADIFMPVDLIVVPAGQFAALKDTPGLVYREAIANGQTVYERPD